MKRLRDTLRCAALGALSILVSLLAVDARAGSGSIDYEFSGRFRLESRWYPETASHPGQRSHASGFVALPNLYIEDVEGRSLTLAPFLRYDGADPSRTHADLREAYLLLFGELGDDEWELRLGVDRVFWGVAESRHLVDIVNQVDLVEHPDEEAKLGQPMIHATWSGDWGAAEMFGLPYHRARTFPGISGRLRAPLVVDNDRVSYESAAGKWHLEFAARYSHGFGPLDIGVSMFDGTGREPFLRLARDDLGTPVLAPYYEQIRQFGLDAQITTGSWLLKLEAIRRAGAQNRLGNEDDYAAFVIGGEYTFYSVFDSAVDLSLLEEWNYDGRSRNATNQFQNDLFLAARLAFNDVHGTEIIASILADIDYATRVLSFELDRRLSDRWSIGLEVLAPIDTDGEDVLVHGTRRDSFFALRLTHNF